LCLSSLALYAITALYVHYRMGENLMDRLDRELSSTLKEFIAETTLTQDGFAARFHDEPAKEFGPQSTTAYYEMFDPGGASVLRSRSLPAGWQLPQVIPIGKKGSPAESFVLPDGRHARARTVQIDGPGEMSNYTLTLVKDATPVEREVARCGRALVVGGLILGLVWLALTILVSGWKRRTN